MLALKLRGERAAAAELAGPMREAWLRAGLRGTVVTWVPGRRPDIRRRGFDHAELLARSVARRLGLAATPLLQRTSARPDQTRLGAAERRVNLAGAFRARPWGHPVVVVDDLVTTGATAAACAAALAEGGAPEVEVLAACRT